MVDLTAYSLEELRLLHNDVEYELDDRVSDQIMEGRDRIVLMAKEIGVSVEDLIGNLVAESKRGRIRYRHRSNRSLEWTGRGRQPAWVREWLANGGALDQLRV